MCRTLLLCAVLFLGCAKSEPPASESTSMGGETGGMATISLADVAGTWDGTVTAVGNDTVLTILDLTATEDPTGWSMKVTNAKTPTMTTLVSGMRVVTEGDGVIVDAGPFQSVLRPGQEVTTHTVYRLEDGKLVGTIQATYPASGETIALRSVSTRKAPQ
jgi:hypothetical protein